MKHCPSPPNLRFLGWTVIGRQSVAVGDANYHAINVAGFGVVRRAIVNRGTRLQTNYENES